MPRPEAVELALVGGGAGYIDWSRGREGRESEYDVRKGVK